MKSFDLHLRIVWTLPSDERDKLGCDIDSKLILIVLVTGRTVHPWIPELIHIKRLLTFCFCIISKACEVDKSGICASARTIASQWLTSFVGPSIKAQVAHRIVEGDGHHVRSAVYRRFWWVIVTAHFYVLL
jgi:hypothetical protein